MNNNIKENVYSFLCVKYQTMTDEQKVVLHTFIFTDKNIVVNAAPGAGKSFMLTVLAEAATAMKLYTLGLSFNISVVEELITKFTATRVKGHIWSTKAFMDFVARSVNTRFLTDDSGRRYYFKLNDAGIIEEIDTEKLGIIICNCNYVDGKPSNLSDVIETFWPGQSDNMSPIYGQAIAILLDSIMYSKYLTPSEVTILPQLVDLQNVTYMKKRGVVYKTADIVMLDEAHDASYGLLKSMKCYNSKARFVFMLDTRQNIYSWAGANPKIAEHITELFQPVQCDLTNTFRCKSEVVKFVNNYTLARGNDTLPINPGKLVAFYEGGKVEYGTLHESISLCREDSFVLTGLNKTALEAYLILLSNNVKVKLQGVNLSKDISFLDSLFQKIKHNYWNYAPEYSLSVLKAEITSDKFDKYIDFDVVEEALKTIVAVIQIGDVLNVQVVDSESANKLVYSLETMVKDATCTVSTLFKIKGEERENVIFYGLAEYATAHKKETPIDLKTKLNGLFVAFTRAKTTLILA